jgi:hypothetical protein
MWALRILRLVFMTNFLSVINLLKLLLSFDRRRWSRSVENLNTQPKEFVSVHTKKKITDLLQPEISGIS